MTTSKGGSGERVIKSGTSSCTVSASHEALGGSVNLSTAKRLSDLNDLVLGHLVSPSLVALSKGVEESLLDPLLWLQSIGVSILDCTVLNKLDKLSLGHLFSPHWVASSDHLVGSLVHVHLGLWLSIDSGVERWLLVGGSQELLSLVSELGLPLATLLYWVHLDVWVGSDDRSLLSRGLDHVSSLDLFMSLSLDQLLFLLLVDDL